MVKIEDLKTLPKEEACKEYLTVSVLHKGVITKYGKEDKLMLTAIIADETGFIKAQIYDADKMCQFQENASCIISNFINKDGYIVVNKPSCVFHGTLINVPECIKESAKDFLTVKPMTINKTSLSPKMTTVQQVTGVVTKVSPTNLKRARSTGEEIPLKIIKLRDTTGDIDICLWRGMATESCKRGEVVRLTNFCVTDTFNSVGAAVPALTNKDSSSSIEVLPPDASYIDLLRENDDQDSDGSSNLPEGSIIGISPIKTYRSCMNDRCYRKQLKDMKCPTCHVAYTSESAGVSAVSSVLISLKDGNHSSYTVFTQQVESLREQLKITTTFTSEEFITALQSKLPGKICFSSQGNKLSKIKVL